MRSGWNATRRNRNVGTGAHGHGSNNKLTIPESRHEFKCFYEKLSSYVIVKRHVADHELQFLIEPTRLGWFYPCTIDDICFALSHVPPAHVATVNLVVMRQPTRKQRVLSPVWGRAIFSFDVDGWGGAAIVLEAQNIEPVAWPVSLAPDSIRELERLRADGHRIARARRRVDIFTTPESLRNTVLYRTLLHELGHHVDHAKSEPEPWMHRTLLSKEDFAHRYAAESLKRLTDLGVAPFAHRFNADDMRACGLQPEWFRADP